MDNVKISKRLSYVLRHAPETIGITLSPDGWVPIDTLLRALAAHGPRVTREQLDAVVAGNDKQRFAIDGDRIRASQGHSVQVELGLTPVEPPELLYHGTARRNLASIYADGVHRGNRHHVHLSADAGTAHKVGSRHGAPVILVVAAAEMADDGHRFYRSANGVWLTDDVPARYLRGEA
ncbi:RNA 2'-phosphotransferase [Catellatospora tritici]|uniref:RNA 2'-phosphotransferase n=1 Tax=Catellatospora tritici TaxID=2851566 RepID=UPI001C2D7008|nr:RNA 2'-phosphotransferase [Catellatospora tritici]MBV1851825.1 RNA 2'-phosphotransferase [Catellatospora tritici]